MNNSEPSTSPQLFNCPTCGAGLPVPETATIKCSYCGSSVVVPPELRPQREFEELSASQPMVIQFSPTSMGTGTQPGRRATGWIVGCVVLSVVAVIIITGILSATGIFATTRSVGDVIESVETVQSIPSMTFPTLAMIIPSETTAAPISPAKITMQFGSEGTGPGQFQDARHIAVDPQGNIFVADYDTGRLQKFDPTGKFLQTITVENNTNDFAIIMDMAADFSGHLHLVRVPDILTFNTDDLSLTQTLPGRFPEIKYRFVAVDPAGSLYAISEGLRFTDLIKMDSSGNEIWTVQGVIFNLDQRANPGVEDVAADGLGTSYVLNAIDARVYKYDVDGNFIDRFGVKGKESGQLDHPSHIVVDPKGRLAISDLSGFDFFTTDGEFLVGFLWDYSLGGIRSYTFDLEGNLYVITSSQLVVKFELDF